MGQRELLGDGGGLQDPIDMYIEGGAGSADLRDFFLDCSLPQLLYLPPPWGDCKSSPFESTFFTNYSMSACRIDCETRYLAENCNCRMVHMPGQGVDSWGLSLGCRRSGRPGGR